MDFPTKLTKLIKVFLCNLSEKKRLRKIELNGANDEMDL